MTTQTIGTAVLDRLHRLGVRHMFGIPGDYVLGLYKLLESSLIQHVATTREDCAGFAADAYARINGIGALCVTYCVGGLNTVTAIACAYAERSPVVLLTGSPGLSERARNPYLHHMVREFSTQREVFEKMTVAAVSLEDPVTATALYNGREVPVMHACGHDAHTAILMGVADVSSKISDKIPGSIKFIFQPSEDSRPDGEDGGAKLMIDQGVLNNPKIEAIFGLHAVPLPVGCIGIRSGGLMAGVDNFWITVRGRATHGGLPWTGIDPIPIAAQIVLGLQTIVSRQLDITQSTAVVTIGRIHGGEQPNMITNEVEITGTIRTYDPKTSHVIRKRIDDISKNIAEGGGALASVSFSSAPSPATFNDPELTKRAELILENTIDRHYIVRPPYVPAGEDFAVYQEKIPGLFLLLGIAPKNQDPQKVALNHSPYFYIDESGLLQGV